MKKSPTKRNPASKKRPLQRVTAPSRGVRGRANADALVRRVLVNRYQTGRCTWEAIGKRYGMTRAQTYLIAHGKRPVPAALRERIRAEHSPRKLRKFIQRVAVPFLAKNWRE